MLTSDNLEIRARVYIAANVTYLRRGYYKWMYMDKVYHNLTRSGVKGGLPVPVGLLRLFVIDIGSKIGNIFNIEY